MDRQRENGVFKFQSRRKSPHGTDANVFSGNAFRAGGRRKKLRRSSNFARPSRIAYTAYATNG